MDSTLNYVNNIQVFIERNIHIAPHHLAPHYFSKYKSGIKYIMYHANKNTIWYIFFKLHKHRFMIHYITNNHFEGQYIR
ncbi:MAG: hypothetical protein M9888_05995 [Chitinophagales bacterium]|nr:hypothetical protein [Chitinophagales bacterium]